eukprot:5640067-Alexandrium_andersonii.AAC.1
MSWAQDSLAKLGGGCPEPEAPATTFITWDFLELPWLLEASLPHAPPGATEPPAHSGGLATQWPGDQAFPWSTGQAASATRAQTRGPLRSGARARTHPRVRAARTARAR